MVKNADKKRALLLLDLWRRDLAAERGDTLYVLIVQGSLRCDLHSLGGLMGVW